MEPVFVLSALMMVVFGATQPAKNATVAPAAAAAITVPAPVPVQAAQAPKKENRDVASQTDKKTPSENKSGWSAKKDLSSKKWK